MLIKFTEDFANNWKAGDIVEAKYIVIRRSGSLNSFIIYGFVS